MSENVLTILHRLMETARDAERGFRTAIAAVNDPAIRRLFAAYAEQRAEFARELAGEVRRLGGTPQRRGSVAGALHRALLNVRAAVTGRDEVAVLDEAERGEHAALRAYHEALAFRELPADVRSVIARQAARVEETHDCLRDLKRAA